MAPEILKDKGYWDLSSDIWSLGVLLYCILTGNMPFKENNMEDLYEAIIKKPLDFKDFEVSSDA